MPYKSKISSLERNINVLENRITDAEKGDNVPLVLTLKEERATLMKELSTLRRKQWEEDHERLDFGDDR